MKRSILATLLLLIASLALAQTPKQPSVREILNPDGALRLDRDGGYSLDGYALQLDASGRPIARPKDEAQTQNSAGSWGAGFHLPNGVDNPVLALAVYNGELYVGGFFTQAGGASANYIARWNGASWNTLGTGSTNGVNLGVRALAVYNGELYVGGGFTSAGGASANRIARWNGASWSALSTGSGNGVNGDVRALAVYKGELYVGGGFTEAGGASANSIARWNGTSWNTLGTGSGNGVNGSVNALAVYNNSLFLGGGFTLVNIGNAPILSSRIAQWTASPSSVSKTQ